jgi:hypothetical protein
MCFSKALCLPWIQPSSVQTPQYKTQDTSVCYGYNPPQLFAFHGDYKPHHLKQKHRNLEKHTLSVSLYLSGGGG